MVFAVTASMTVTDKLVDAAARRICGHTCLRLGIFSEPCLLPDGRNGPCEATEAQLVLSGKTALARDVLAGALRQLTAELDAP